MKRLLSVFLWGFIAPAAFTQTNHEYPIVSDFGPMVPFYRYQPALAEWFHVTPETIQMPVPAFMTDARVSFPYKKRAFAREILFCDNVTVVRFLGGWSASRKGLDASEAAKVDLAYRDEKGAIRYRWELLPARLEPLIKMGYTKPTIVLDNVPWCFPRLALEPDAGKTGIAQQPKGYGQNQPPADLEEWAAFIEELCRQLVKLHGFEMVNQWSFRLGTEMNQKARWSGTAEEYATFYIKTARAVRHILPGASFGPYNRAGVEFASLAALAAQAKDEQVPFDWVATSFYSVGKMKGNEPNYDVLDPDAAIARHIIPTWNAVSKVAARGEALPREIHEYGWFLVNEHGVNDFAPGARGAAGNFYTMFALRKAGLNKLYHWNLKDPVWENDTPLLSSQAWLFSILDHTAGSRVVELRHELKSPPSQTIKHKAVGFFGDHGRSHLMVAAYNMNRDELTPNTISVFVPASLLPGRNFEIRATWMDNSTDPYLAVRNELEKAGLLVPSLRDQPHVVQAVNLMSANGAGYRHVAENYRIYESMMRENLTLKAYPGQVSYSEQGTVFTFPISSPTVMVLAIE